MSTPRRSTRKPPQGQLQRGSLRDVVTAEPIDLDAQHLRCIVARQQRKLAVLSAVVTLLLAMVRIRGLKLDATRLPTGTSKRAVMHAITRMILAWEVTPKLSPLTTCRLLSIAASHLHDAPPSDTTLISDSGGENVNADVDACVEALRIYHVLAQVDVAYSNSMIEAFWRALKHNWLYLSSLDSIETVRKLVAFFVEFCGACSRTGSTLRAILETDDASLASHGPSAPVSLRWASRLAAVLVAVEA